MSAPRFWPTAFRVFDLSLGQMIWSRRTILMALVVGGPVAVAVAIRIVDALMGASLRTSHTPLSGEAAFGTIIWLLYIRIVLPILAVFYGTALIADEVEDKTITYLFTRPIRRGAVLMGKYLAYLACTVLVVLPSVVIVYLLMATRAGTLASDFPGLLRDLLVIAVGLAVYGAVFAFVGAWFRRPLVAGLLFAFGWEPAAAFFPGYVKRLTIAHYLDTLVPHLRPSESGLRALQALVRDSPSAGLALAVLGGILGVSLLLAVRTVEQREYVLDQ